MIETLLNMPNEKTLLSKRAFLKSAALGATSLAVPFGLVGCPKKDPYLELEEVVLEKTANWKYGHWGGVIVPHNGLHVFGGSMVEDHGSGSMEPAHEILYPNNDIWVVKDKLDTPTQRPAYFVLGDIIYFVGGRIKDPSSYSMISANTAYYYGLETGDQGILSRPFPHKTSHVKAVVIKGIPYILVEGLDNIYSHNEEGKWPIVGKMQERIRPDAVVALHENIYVFDNKGRSCSLRIYNTEDEKWKQGKMPRGLKEMMNRDRMLAFVHNQGLYFWEEQRDNSRNLAYAVLYKYLTEKNFWTKICAFRLPCKKTKNEHRAFYRGYMYFLGPTRYYDEDRELSKPAYRLSLKHLLSK